ncbi:myosin-IIIb [Lepeophtheirus salmonis]|uniref:myosin-IIIb n=1 Tax=Lepeophtheirus salmonis TaxID=72036 RepID=UPI001AE7F41F|nr:myosin-IIIb-like [Lepeophtheirus salmonis]
MSYTGISKVIDFESLPDPQDKFNLTNLIGEGTFGEVYEATLNDEPERHVAIKVIDNITDNIEEIEQEYQVLTTHWFHPNIPHFEGLYLKKSSSGDEIWMVMDLCDGGSVTDLIESLRDHQLPSLSEEEVCYILSEVTHSLNYLHTQKTIHRDIKGHNIMLTSSGDVKLIDYGIACNIKDTYDKRHTSVGTPYWMAPEVISCEQLKTHAYDSRCDVWSLGITAIELAEGKAPLSELHPMRALFQIPRNPPPALLKVERWSEDFVEFVNECLIKDYEQRPFIMELMEHPFLQRVPKNPSYIKNQLQIKIENVKCLYNQSNHIDPTIRRGLLRIKRSADPILILVDDLASLDDIDTDTICTYLQMRYNQNKIYTYIGEIIISINPCKTLNIYSAHEMCKYRNKSKYDNLPHVYAMANSSYHNMIHEKKNQRFIISGESGAGKTMSANWVMKMLVYLGKAPNRNLEDKILQINPILEAFGNAKTPLNGNSSRFAKVVEITYSVNGKVTGARISVFLLEHSRVTSDRDIRDDCNFHIFYYLVKGLNHYGKSNDYYLNEIHRFLGDQVTPLIKDYDNFIVALKSLGFRENDLETIYTIIASILNIGDLDFTPVETDDNVGGCKVSNPDILDKIVKLLGVNKEELVDCFQNSTVSTKGEVITRSNSPEEAKFMRDAFAKGLYSRFFDYIVYSINKLLSYSLNVYGESNSIGILDIFGFETLETNSFEQLCINTTNEQLFYYFNQVVFRMEKEEYEMEGIFVKMESYSSNHSILDLLLSRPLGLFALIDEECKFPSSTETTLLSKLNNNLEKFDAYSHPKQEFQLFVIQHYAQKVEYSPNQFLDKNRNFLPPELIAVMRYSQNEIIRFLFNCPITKTGRLSCSNNSAPVTPDICKMATETHSQTRSQQTLSTFFRYSLTDLLKNTLNGTPHFIKCFKPNKFQKPGNLDTSYLMSQLQYSGVFQTVKIRQIGYPCRLTFAEFLRRYCFLGFSFDERVVATKENCQILMLRLRMDGYALGKTKVFLKYYHVEYLSKLYEYQIRKIIKVQGIVRSWLAKINTQKMKWAVLRDLMLAKRFSCRWRYRVKNKMSIEGHSVIEKKMIYKPSKKFVLTEDIHMNENVKVNAALEIQRHIRGFIVRKKIGPLLAEKIQKMINISDTSEEKMNEITGELKDEGLSEEEAAKFIQTMFKKNMLKKKSTKTVTRTMQEKRLLLVDLIQVLHLNNVDTHKYYKYNKLPIELEDVKEVNLENPIITVSSNIEKRPPVPTQLITKNEPINNKYIDPNVKRRYSMTHFYSDGGPHENWDSFINRHIHRSHKTRGLISKNQDVTPKFLTPQSILLDSASSELIQRVQNEVSERARSRRGSRDSRSSNPSIHCTLSINQSRKGSTDSRGSYPSINFPSSPEKTDSRTHSFAMESSVKEDKQPNPSFIQQMHTLKKKPDDSFAQVDDDDSGPYDFRNLLRRTNYAPTDSLRRRIKSSDAELTTIKPSVEGITFDDDCIEL